MKIAILHQDLEWSEEEMKRIFESKGLTCDLFNISQVSIDELENYDLVLNRVYASVANRNYNDNLRTLKLLEEIEKKGVLCINSYITTKVDYSKYYSSVVLEEHRVRTPKTLFINNINDYEKVLEFSKIYSFPLIVKRDMGGRGIDVHKVDNYDELKEIVYHMLSDEYKKSYDAGIVIQEYLKNNRGYDCRIAIVNGKFAFAFKRYLIPDKEGDEAWLASVSRGSKKEYYEPSQAEIEVAMKATKAIGAMYNEVDMTFTDEGIAIIENNPTPNYFKDVDNEKLESGVVEILSIFDGVYEK